MLFLASSLCSLALFCFRHSRQNSRAEELPKKVRDEPGLIGLRLRRNFTGFSCRLVSNSSDSCDCLSARFSHIPSAPGVALDQLRAARKVPTRVDLASSSQPFCLWYPASTPEYFLLPNFLILSENKKVSGHPTVPGSVENHWTNRTTSTAPGISPTAFGRGK